MLESLEAGMAARAFLDSFLHLQSLAPGAWWRELEGLRWLHYPEAQEGLPDEFFALNGEPEQVVATIQAHAPGLPHWLSVLDPWLWNVRRAYADLDYDVRETEFLMARPLLELGASRCTAPVQQVTTWAEAEALNAARGYVFLHPNQLNDPWVRCRYITHEGQPVSWGLLVLLPGRPSYLANLYTVAAYRRQGYAEAVLSALHEEAAASGADHNVLLSHRDAHALYKRLGYDDQTFCQMFQWRPEASA